jgi:hypothetical protein
MWIEWVNPKTKRRERIYNYCAPDSAEGKAAIEATKRSLALRFRVHADLIPGLTIRPAEMLAPGRGFMR